MKRKKLTVHEWSIAVLIAIAVVGSFYYIGGFPGIGFLTGASAPATSIDTTTLPASVNKAAATVTAVPGAEGLLFEDLEVGSGPEAKRGMVVTVHYAGYLEDGTIFDSSFEGEPFTLQLGSGEVIPGFDLGIVGMKEGGRRAIFIPSALAYGANAIGSIPPNSNLVFEIVLLNATNTP